VPTLAINDRILTLIDESAKNFGIDIKAYKEKTLRMVREEHSEEQIVDLLIKNALENIDEANPNWTYVAAQIYIDKLYRQAAKNRNYSAEEKYGGLYQLINSLVDKGVYSTNIIKKYSKEEIDYFASKIEPERDLLFDYLGLYTLATRYLATDYEKNVYELPQERWMIIAMHLMQEEAETNRKEQVLEAYWALSNLYMTVATPTLTNAGKSHGQLSSCFIDTVDDSLQAIYD